MTPMAVRSARATCAVALTVAGTAMLVVGYLYLVSGLVVPGYALVPATAAS